MSVPLISTGEPEWDEQIAASRRRYEQKGWEALEQGRYGGGFFVRYRAPEGACWTVYERLKAESPHPQGTRQRVTWQHRVAAAVSRLWRRRSFAP